MVLLLHFLTSAPRKEASFLMTSGNEKNIDKNILVSNSMPILRPGTITNILTFYLRRARPALSKIAIAPTNYLGIYELMVYL